MAVHLDAAMDGYVGVVISMPAVAMLMGSAAVFVCRLPDKVQAGFQMFSAGLLISAVANELFPLLKPSDQPSQGPWPLLIGFTVGLVFMFGLGYLTEFMEDDDDEEAVKHKRTNSDIETALVDICEQEREKAKQHFELEVKEIDGEVNRLQGFLAQGSQNQIDELLHSLEYRVHRATRVLYLRSGIDDQNLTRMQFHGRELKQSSERLQRFESFQKAKDNLKAFQACLEHLHGHAERVPFRRWKAMAKPAEDEKLPEELPLALVTAVVVDAAVDGMLIGLSYAASPSAGWAMAIATCIEMGFLGLSFTASLQNATRTAWKIITVAGIPPVVLLLAGLGGNSLGYMFSESPGTFVAFISFAIVALLFLVTQELLTEAQSVANGSAVINALFFVGLLCGILLEAYIG